MPPKIFKLIKIVGFISFVPLILVAGPLFGYFTGEYLEKRFNFGNYVSIALSALGFAGSVKETVRIFRLVLKMEREP